MRSAQIKIINLLFIALFFISSNVLAQTEKDNIKSDFSEYLSLLKQKEFDKSLDYMVPEFFEMFPREQMVSVMEQTFNSPEMEISFKDSEILKVGKVKKIEDKHYAKMAYSNTLEIKTPVDENETEEERGMRVGLLTGVFGKTFGPENVKYNADSKGFEIYSEKDVISVSENGDTAWKFVVLEKDQMELLEKMVPEKAIKLKY